MYARWFVLLGVVVSLLTAGCTGNGGASDSDRRGGFYGGISSGGTWP